MSDAIATCPIDGEQEAENGLVLTSSFLKVTKKGSSRKYALSPHMKLEINHRQLLGPLVGGALLSCFSLVTLFTVNNWALLLLTSTIAGLGFVYHGFVGIDVLTLREDKIHYDVALPKIPTALPAFVRFYNSLVPRIATGTASVFAIYYLPSVGPEEYGHLYVDRPVSEERRLTPAVVDLLKLPFTVKFAFDGDSHYSAPVPAQIPEEAYLSPYQR